MSYSVDEITFLNFDYSLTEQKNLHKFPHHWIDCSHILHTNGYCEAASLSEIRKKLHAGGTGNLVFIGNGNYHYVSYLLLERITLPFSLILFDHHSDMMDASQPLISCGSWVAHALRDLPLLQKVVIIGVNETDAKIFVENRQGANDRIYMISEHKLHSHSLHEIMSEVGAFLGAELNIYVSIDKDVLFRTEAMTNWDQGTMSLVQLLFLLEKFMNKYQVLGLDVCGEYIFNDHNHFQAITGEHIKMNEIVNRSLIDLVTNLSDTREEQEQIVHH
ncbi:arginase family protein [Caldibacillus lycopersici]|uniref:Arginase family protein n=1 Tax=Perspicuibacillus lycopersici TaxID=1325689 RepID=A0AAE3ITR3_9BACI|nr:arginase family protein [Perspicuibacillus lycopersici]MCU9614465.1 arginase family protein [Perspicuibacillus lycopersici]